MNVQDLKNFFFAAGVQRACLQLSRGQQAVVGHPSRREGLPGSNPDGQVRALIILIFEILKTWAPVEEKMPLDGNACPRLFYQVFKSCLNL